MADDGQERGSVTAEFAILLPAVMLVVLCCLGALAVIAQQMRLQDAAFVAARTLARGESADSASDRVRALVSGAVDSHTNRGDLVCVRTSARARVGGVGLGVVLSAQACALGPPSTEDEAGAAGGSG